MELITKEVYNCPFCEEDHELEIYKELTKGNINGRIFEYVESFYFCPIEKERFGTGKMVEENLAEARKVYKDLVDGI